jgi:hypothetical protein
MTQRRIESIAGWVAVGLWFVSVCVFVVGIAMSQHMPDRTVVRVAATTKTARLHGKLVTRDVPAVVGPNPRYVDYQLTVGFIMLGSGGLFVISCIPAVVWWWRRRHRIRAETLAEALARYPDASRLRDSGALRI